MLSKALSHYPQFRFREGEKRLWNPILKQTFAVRPEERVRLALVDYLTLEANCSVHRISFESPVKLPNDKSKSRTDIIYYDKDFAPLLLTECKAPSIKLDEKTALQVGRYNQKVKAPFVLVSNGFTDFWFKLDEGNLSPLKEIPEPFKSSSDFDRTLSYWEDRAFAGKKLHPEARNFIWNSSNQLFKDPHHPVTFLTFKGYPPEFALGHYYRIFGLEKNLKIAVTIAGNRYGGTRLNVVLNQKGSNTAFLTSSINLIAEQEALNTEIHSAKGVKELDITEAINFSFEKNIPDLIPEFSVLLQSRVSH